MSEPAASFRPLSGAEEFDRRIRSLAQAQPNPSDALAELARLVGQHDPFGESVPHAHSSHDSDRRVEEVADRHDEVVSDPYFHGYADAGEEPGAPIEPAVVQGPDPEPWERAVPLHPSVAVRTAGPIEPSPDLWAQGVTLPEDEIGPPPSAAVPAPAEATSPKRTLVVLAAVVLLTGGGLAASFLARPSTAAVASSAATTPTIMAATGPTKVQPETATGADASSEPSTLLDKNKNDGTAVAKVVNTVEQPVDLGQAIKASSVDPADTPAAVSSAFPEPRKVKTVLVRPDGSVIADAPPSASDAASAAMPSQASLAFDPQTALPVNAGPPPAAAAAVPAAPPVVQPPSATTDWANPTPPAKTTTRAGALKPAASTTQDGSAAAQARSTVATPKTKPVAKIVKPKAKPAATTADGAVPVGGADTTATTVADAAPATPAEPASNASSGGGFAIQLGAAPTEAEGRTAATRLGQKYAGDLGGASPLLHKATAGGKTVYRIRVGNLSQDAAKALCAKVQAGGGGCFVARN